jgi:hypothetical protein
VFGIIIKMICLDPVLLIHVREGTVLVLYWKRLWRRRREVLGTLQYVGLHVALIVQ